MCTAAIISTNIQNHSLTLTREMLNELSENTGTSDKGELFQFRDGSQFLVSDFQQSEYWYSPSGYWDF